LPFHGKLAHLNDDPAAFRRLLTQSRRHDWSVYARPPFGGPEQALKYLARYTHRIAISNHRLLAVDPQSVTFSWKDYAHANQPRTMALETGEFARRFLLHVLPSHFVRIRSFGFLANSRRTAALQQCRTLLAAQPQSEAACLSTMPENPECCDDAVTDRPATPCPRCNAGTLHRSSIAAYDTS
jgi:hypothetical protein